MNGPAIDPGAQCDNVPEPDNSEACQGLWVWYNLNRTIRRVCAGNALARGRWSSGCHPYPRLVQCVPAHPLRLPLARMRRDGSLDWEGWAPQDFNPYNSTLPRWFRTTNDSTLTEYVDPDRFHKGTMHPTYRAHLTIADAVLREAFSE